MDKSITHIPNCIVISALIAMMVSLVLLATPAVSLAEECDEGASSAVQVAESADEPEDVVSIGAGVNDETAHPEGGQTDTALNEQQTNEIDGQDADSVSTDTTLDNSQATEGSDTTPEDYAAGNEPDELVDTTPTETGATSADSTEIEAQGELEEGAADAKDEPGAVDSSAIESTAADKPVAAAVAPKTQSASASTTVTAKRASGEVKAGWYSLKTALSTAFYVHAKSSKSKAGTSIILKKLSAATGQAFKLQYVGGRWFRLMCGSGYKSRIHVDENGKVTLSRTGSHNTMFRFEKDSGGYRLINLATGLALAVYNNKAGSGVAIVGQTSVAGKKSQVFKLEKRNGLLRDGVYSIRTSLSGNRSLSPYKGRSKTNTTAVINNYKGDLYQKWQIKAVAGKTNVYTIENIATGYLLTGVPGKAARLRTANPQYNQWWIPYGLNSRVLFKNRATGKVLDLKNGSSASNTLTNCGSKTTKTSQKWILKRVNPVSTGIYEFDLAANKSLAMEIPESSTAQNAVVKIWDDINTPNQRWYYDASSKTLTNVNSGKVLTVKGSAIAGASAVQANANDANTQKWTFTYVGKGKFKIVSVANRNLVLKASGKTRESSVNLAPYASSNYQSWRIKQSKGNVTTYINLGFSLDQMARWQKSGNPYLASYTLSYVKSVLNPNNGSKYKFLDLRKSTSISASKLDAFINRYGSTGKMKGLGKAFAEAAKTYRINEAYLVAHAILESDWGRSQLASGYYYKGGYIDGKYYKKGTYYNFFGIGAYDNSPLSGGRKLAIINGWNTPAKAVTGAAKWISGNYIYATNSPKADRYPQPTLYAMKWDLARTKAIKQYGWHQYATSTTWADSIGNLIGQILVAANSSAGLNFIVPKYK